MDHPKKIEDLLHLFTHGQLSEKDRLDLYQRMNSDDDQEHTTAWFYKIWDETQLSKADYRSVSAFNELKQKLNLDEKALRMNINSFNAKRNSFVWLKYAAIFILASGILWVIYTKALLPVKFSERVSNELSIPNGSRGSIVLADGSKIWLNSGSRLVYSDFNLSKTREVYLEGEAFFDVKANPKKPFIVNTSSIKVKVLGTKFNVKSYPAERISEATLVSGKVEIEEINSPGLITLAPNQKATFINHSIKEEKNATADRNQPIEKDSKIIQNVNTETTTSWKDDKLIFYNERFENLVVKLERWYDVKIVLKDTVINNFRYTGTFEKENIEQALNALKLASPMKYTIKKNHIEIYASK